MRTGKIKKALALTMTAMMMFSTAACGKKESGTVETVSKADSVNNADASAVSADSPYKDKGFDLTKREEIVFYVVGERPQDADMVFEKLNNDYLIPWLNTTLNVQFISWSDIGTKYSLLLAGGDKIDAIYTSSWCNYNSEAAKGAFKELTPEFLQTYMPYSYPVQAAESWDQVSISGKIYAIPKNNAGFNNYNVIAVRSDLMDKYNIEEINSWDSLKSALTILAENETANGVYANGQRGCCEFADHLWWQKLQVESLASGYDFMYYTHGDEKLPDWDKDVFYKYLSQDYLDMCLEMAEMAKLGIWSPDRINDTTDPMVNFESGRTATLVWNSAVISSGQNVEKNGVGTFEVFDVTPECKARRGSYADDTMAIAAVSEHPERTALVLDCIKGFPEVNNLVVGGIEGVHYELSEDGRRMTTDKSESYAWGCWAWGLTGRDSLAEYSEDPRSSFFNDICTAKEYAPIAAGFTFDKQSVEAEMSVIGSIVEEYGQSFNLGLFGDNTEAKYEEFVEKLKAAGIDKVMEECKRQYQEFYDKKTK